MAVIINDLDASRSVSFSASALLIILFTSDSIMDYDWTNFVDIVDLNVDKHKQTVL